MVIRLRVTTARQVGESPATLAVVRHIPSIQE